jgi:oligopeptidase B
LSILDRGFVFAIAHRGGEDLGRQWYEDGKLLKEKYFTDFIDCSKF